MGLWYNINMATIYLIKSKTSGKCYVGQTNHTAIERWRTHVDTAKRISGCAALYSAIRKYGENDFEITEITNGEYDKKKLNELEKKYIKEFKTLSPNGYNLQTGGNSFNLSQEVKDKISKALKGRNITWKHKTSVGIKKLWQNKEYRSMMSAAHMGKRGKYKKHNKPLRLSLPISKIMEMKKSGQSIYKISKHFGVSFEAIKKRIKYGD